MSGNTQEHTTGHRAPRNAPPVQAQETTSANGASNGASAAPALGNVTIEIAGLEVTVPVKFGPGHTLTENEAKVLDAAYQRQFTNNQNAMAKSRAEALGKATTDAERAAKAPLTATDLVALYSTYEPSVGGTPRQSAMEKIRSDAAWRFWTGHTKAHNNNFNTFLLIPARRDESGKVISAAVTREGYTAVVPKAGANLIAPLTPKRGVDGKVTVTVGEQRDAMTARLLTMPEYADRIQVQVDAIMAERGSKQTVEKPDAVSLSADDLL